jgi:hypothetical protein
VKILNLIIRYVSDKPIECSCNVLLCLVILLVCLILLFLCTRKVCIALISSQGAVVRTERPLYP